MNVHFSPEAEAFANALGGSGRLLGLDLGTKTIGVAICDDRWSIASPRTTLRRSKFSKDAEALIALMDAERITGLVLGFPVNMDGSEGPRCQATRAFQRNFEKLRPVPILMWDERLSTVAAERAMLEADLSRRKRAQNIDQIAAALILQSAVDALRRFR